jgi:hypothetical protein
MLGNAPVPPSPIPGSMPPELNPVNPNTGGGTRYNISPIEMGQAPPIGSKTPIDGINRLNPVDPSMNTGQKTQLPGMNTPPSNEQIYGIPEIGMNPNAQKKRFL